MPAAAEGLVCSRRARHVQSLLFLNLHRILHTPSKRCRVCILGGICTGGFRVRLSCYRVVMGGSSKYFCFLPCLQTGVNWCKKLCGSFPVNAYGPPQNSVVTTDPTKKPWEEGGNVQMIFSCLPALDHLSAPGQSSPSLQHKDIKAQQSLLDTLFALRLARWRGSVLIFHHSQGALNQSSSPPLVANPLAPSSP